MKQIIQTRDLNIFKIVKEFRKGLLAGNKSHNTCFILCWPLRSYLKFCGISNISMICGKVANSNHVWLQLPDGRIIDPTADQFKRPNGKKMPRIYIGKLPYWYKIEHQETHESNKGSS